VGHGDGFIGVLRGLYHAHLGWTFNRPSLQETERHAPDLIEDEAMRRFSGKFHLFVTLGLVAPMAAGFLIKGTAMGALTGLLWGGLVRVFFGHHITWSINSICHFFGTRRFDTEDKSTNVFWLALPSLGESWHHNHHAFPRSAVHGLRWWQVDVSAGVIRLLELCGLAKNVVRISPERQREREAAR
jgi:stearoyl-CoA desaturase (delta-9 desaturase)